MLYVQVIHEHFLNDPLQNVVKLKQVHYLTDLSSFYSFLHDLEFKFQFISELSACKH